MDIAARIANWHRPILVLAAVAAVASAVSLWRPGLSDEYSLSSLAGNNSQQFRDLEAFIDEFAGVELTLIVVRSENALSPETQECLEEVVKQSSELPAVDGAASICQAPKLLRRFLADTNIAKGLLVSSDKRAASIILQMRDDSVVKEMTRGETVAALKQIVAQARAEHPGHEVVLTGPYVLSYEMTHLVWDDLVTFGMLGAAASLVVLLLSLGSFRLAAYPLLVGVASVAITLGLSVWLGINTALNLPMLVLLTAVLTIANCVHLAVGHDETRGHAEITIRRLIRPCTGVVATTMVGFGAVGVSALEPVRTFALLMLLGLGVGLVLSLAGACGTLTQYKTQPMLSRPIDRLLRGSLLLARKNPLPIMLLFLIVGIGGAALTAKLQFSLRFLENFRPDDEIRTNYEFVQDTLTPMQSMELLIDRRDGSQVLSPHSLAAIDQLTEEYGSREPIVRMISVVDLFKFGNFDLPTTDSALKRRTTLLTTALKMFLGDEPLAEFVHPEKGTMRVAFFASEGPDAASKIELGDEICARAEELLGDEYQVRMTGLYYFYAHVARELLRDQVVSLIASTIGVLLTMALVLKSWRLAFIGMMPPLFAGASCVGLMAIFHVPFNTVTSMMLAIALGIAVDDTIHYLWRYRSSRAKGQSVKRAIATTQLSVGRACTLTSVVIAAGFAVMGMSRFLPIAYFGCVISVVMAVALAANLLMLPALLAVVDRWRMRTQAARLSTS
ncbi:efflux RND transporter permease subunit [Aeoliella mucimassa]|uniref:MMPL family protein n=1 Tax=Aeoliella mucimassa TaxID=2527972 RepID=A0A518AKJ9_9BACT|nr:MMPL family transporter [Aeoliella mucimassa]QDU55255.1 MMPL family protein [Aeoliella mucimassa]